MRQPVPIQTQDTPANLINPSAPTGETSPNLPDSPAPPQGTIGESIDHNTDTNKNPKVLRFPLPAFILLAIIGIATF